MALEIERKFLISDPEWKSKIEIVKEKTIKQGYIFATPQKSFRVRITDGKALITLKSKTQKGGAKIRHEYEYEIPMKDGLEMLELCDNPAIEKTRYVTMIGGIEWVIDNFEGVNEGLLVAEVELESEDQEVEMPAWLGKEITDDVRYLNSNISQNPYCDWKDTV